MYTAVMIRSVCKHSVVIEITTSIYRYLLVLECKTHGRQLHLAKWMMI